MIVNSNLSLDFELDQNRRSKSAGLESELSTIQFGTPNHISLLQGETADACYFLMAYSIVFRFERYSDVHNCDNSYTDCIYDFVAGVQGAAEKVCGGQEEGEGVFRRVRPLLQSG